MNPLKSMDEGLNIDRGAEQAEPVAWMMYIGDQNIGPIADREFVFGSHVGMVDFVPLYTHPPATDIITKGWMVKGHNPDQMDNPIKQRGWFVYPEEGEDMIEVMIVRVER